MRGNPIVEIVAILVMLVSVLVGGAYWGAYNKQEKKEENVLQTRHKQSNMNSSFESLQKKTE
jgi:flagellar basal body-associated protein FliL